MEKDRLKSILAGMGIASLVAGMSAVPVSVQGASGWGGKTGAGSAQPQTEAGKSGWGGKAGAVSADKDKVSKDKKAAKKATDKKPAVTPEKKPGSSGWGGAAGAGGAK